MGENTIMIVKKNLFPPATRASTYTLSTLVFEVGSGALTREEAVAYTTEHTLPIWTPIADIHPPYLLLPISLEEEVEEPREDISNPRHG